jgi:hypothetical protein
MRVLAAILLALGLGLGSAYGVVMRGLAAGNVSNGPWRTSFATGRVDADPWTRARVAVGGLLALAPSETVYWNAAVDDGGQTLSSRCEYRLSGGELAARWWSVTAYGADAYLIANEAGRYSLSQTTLARDPGGGWTAAVSTRAQPGNWLPSGRPGEVHDFQLTLRLYNPELAIYERPESAALPHVERGTCS